MRGHGEGEVSLAKKPSDNVGEVVNGVEDWGEGGAGLGFGVKALILCSTFEA